MADSSTTPDSHLNANWCLYVVTCADNSFYAGITTDVNRRVEEHNHSPKGARYTRGRRPVALLKTWAVENRSAAAKAEYAFKRLPRRQKIAVIDGRTVPPWCA